MSDQQDSSNDKPKAIVCVIADWNKQPGKPPAEMQYGMKCPEGHKNRLGNRPPMPNKPIRCDECNIDYEWKKKRPGSVS